MNLIHLAGPIHLSPVTNCLLNVAGSGIGWRVEFRSMEAQLTDFENAAFTVMTVLISRVLLAFRLNLYIPLSKVDANMATAHKRDSVIKDTFWFRKHMATPESLAEVRFDRVAVERYIFDLWLVRMGRHRGEI